MSPQRLAQSFSSVRLNVRDQISFHNFQYGHHWNRRNLPILNFQVIPMPPTKLDPIRITFGSRRGLKIFKMATWRPPWVSERNDFSHSKSLCCSNASHQVSALSDLRFEMRCRLKIFKMADMATILVIGME